MSSVRIDEMAYTKVARGLVKRVVTALIDQFADEGLLDLSGSMAQDDLDFVFVIAFRVMVQFEDFAGHTLGADRHPVVVGFLSVPQNTPPGSWGGDEILISPRRTDLHGGLAADLIREVFAEVQDRRNTASQRQLN